MSTPFEFFRRHQKVALAAITGAAVLSFVVFDASGSNDPSPMALAALVIGCLALVGWIWGARDGKSGENAIFGAVLGLAITLIFMFLGRPPAAISATSGNISRSDLGELNRKRTLANRMVNLVYYGGNPNAGFLAQYQLPQYMFGFGSQDQNDDVLITELLHREANDLGIQVTDEAAMNFLKEVAGKDADGQDNLTKKVFADAIKNITAGIPGSSEDSVIEALRHELRARQTAKVLLGGQRMTPADVWDLHRKLNTRQSAQFVALPVDDFVDKDAKPSDAELKQIFETYKGNDPNFTSVIASERKLEEGRPGLYLSRRVRLAYLEPVYEDMEKQAGEITEEEIQKRYEERYQREMPAFDPHGDLNLPDMPLLPNVPKGTEAPADPAAPSTDKPAEPAAPATEASKPAEGTPAAEESKPAEPAPPAEAKPEAAAPEAQPAEPAAPATETKPEEPAAKPEGSSLRPRLSQLQPVVLIQDAPAAPAAETPAPAAEAAAATPPATETPAAPATEEKPAEEKPAEEKPAETKPAEDPAPPATETPADAPLSVPPVDGADPDGDPAPPVAKVRPLDETLRQQIRDELLAEKTRPLVEAKVNDARDFMNELHLGVAEYLAAEKIKEGKKPELSKEAITPEEATTRLKDYAKKHGLVYTETELLTLDELLTSDDHPLGGAMVGPQGRQGRVVDMVYQSQPDVLYSAMAAFDIDQKGSYAYWKIEDVAEHVPKSMDEPGVKDKVIQVWRTLKARTIAEQRAQALSEIISKSDKPLAEALAEQTVTGDAAKSVFVTVKSTGEFSWLQRSLTPQRFGGDNSPRLGAIQGVVGASDSFMNTVFNTMKPGATGVVPNADKSVFYVMRIEKRSPETPVEIEVMRKQFLESQGDLAMYAQQQSRSRDGSFAERLFVKHGVKMSRTDGGESGEN